MFHCIIMGKIYYIYFPIIIQWNIPIYIYIQRMIQTIPLVNAQILNFDPWIGIEKFMFMGFPLHRLSVDHLTEEDTRTNHSVLVLVLESTCSVWQELHSLAGNAQALHVVLTSL